MPLFVMLLLLVVSAPARTALNEAEQIKRHKEELQALREKHGDDADKRFKERLRVL
jgi:hypothetical protein